MRTKKIIAVACAVCASLALGTGVFAQDDLDNLLNDLEGDVKKKPAEAKPAAPAPAPEAKPAETKPAAPAPAPEAKPAEEKPAEPAPAPAVEEKPAEEKPAEPAPEPAPEEKPAEEKPAAPAPADEVDNLLAPAVLRRRSPPRLRPRPRRSLRRRSPPSLRPRPR